MEPEGSSPHSQVLDIYSYPEPQQSSPWPHIPLPEDHYVYEKRWCAIGSGPRTPSSRVWFFRYSASKSGVPELTQSTEVWTIASLKAAYVYAR